MFPRELPTSIRDDPGRRSESRVFDAFAHRLSDDFSVFYSVAWLNRSKGGTLEDGETDFVIGHPDLGVLIVEVKGGGIQRDGSSNRWWSIDRYGNRHRIKDPFDQARRSKYALLGKLRDQPALNGQWIEIGQAVVLPDCRRPITPLGTDAPDDIVAFTEDLDGIDRWVSGAFKAYQSDRAGELGQQGISVLEGLLAPTFQLKTPLAVSVRRDDRQLVTLTEEQFRVFDLLSRNRRVAISGGPGSGKSVLAAEKARRLAEEGLRTLFLCFNRPLADHLERAFEGQENLTIHTFHSLCKQMAEDAGLLQPGWKENPPSDFFSVRLPPLMLEALDALPEARFDAIVVDEGQDFEADWWELIDLAQEDAGAGILYMFYDPTQNIRGIEGALPGGLLPPLTLTRNLRNTRSIHRLARRFAPSEPLDLDGPEGRDVEFIEVEDEAGTKKELSRLLHRLVREERVPPEDIAVLSGRGQEHTAFSGVKRIGAFECGPSPPVEGRIVLETVRRYKGLDSPVVVLLEIDGLMGDNSLMHVAVTRARSHLAVIASRETVATLRADG